MQPSGMGSCAPMRSAASLCPRLLALAAKARDVIDHQYGDRATGGSVFEPVFITEETLERRQRRIGCIVPGPAH